MRWTSYLRAGCAAVCLLSTNVLAKHIDPNAYGDQLAGSDLIVHYSSIFSGVPLETGSETVKILGDPSTHEGYASSVSFSFQMLGDTAVGTWELTNLTGAVPDPLATYISKIEIDVRPSRGGIDPSLFDDDSLPSTPDSGDGVLGVIPSVLLSTGPAPSSAVESLPWTDPDNLGDMYGKETLTWSGAAAAMLGPGKSFVWYDDTDLAPEPASLALLVAAIWALKRSPR